MVSFFVVEKVIDKKNVSKIHKTVPSASLFNTLVVERDFQIIKPIFMIHVKVGPNLRLRISAGHMSHHKICSSLNSI